MSHKLDNDYLGAAGESRLQLLCAQANLVCNKSSRDLTGWDFLVEFPASKHDGITPLDQRQTTSCLIQLKSTAQVDRSRVSLLLSATERIAKDPRPAMVIVLQLKPDGEPVAGYIVHLLGDPLARVLKRLRIAQARKRWDINHTTITFDFRKDGIRFDLTALGLRDGIAHLCGSNPACYIAEKQRQLADLGYERGRFELEGEVSIENRQHLRNLLLGLVPLNLQPPQVFDVRFGIRIPYSGPSPLPNLADYRITPTHLGTAQISIRGPTLAPPAMFTGEGYVRLPNEETGGVDLLIRHPDFRLIIQMQTGRVCFEAPEVVSIGRPLHRWVPLLRALDHLTSGERPITIVGLKSLPTLTFRLGAKMTKPAIDRLSQLSRFVDGWQQLLEIAGVRSAADISLDDLLLNSSLSMIVDMLLNPTPGGELLCGEFEDFDPPEDPSEPMEALLFGTCRFADASISYCAKVVLARTDEGPLKYRSTALTRLDIRPEVDDEEAYAEEQLEQHGLELMIDQKRIRFRC